MEVDEWVVAPIPILAVPYTAFSGNAAGGPHQAHLRAPAPEPRWGRAVQRWLRFAVAEDPRGSLLQRYAILAPPSAVDFAHNWNAAFHLCANSGAPRGHLDRLLSALSAPSKLLGPNRKPRRHWGRVRGHRGLRQQPPHLAGGVGSSNPRASSLERPH